MQQPSPHLIGISGRIGSGKDTVAQIIQVLNSVNIKDSSVAHLLEYYETTPLKSSWTVKKFAGKLKEVASMLTNIPVHKFEDQEFKKTLLGPEWDSYGILRKDTTRQIDIQPEPHSEDSVWLKNADNTEIHNQMTVREFLQKLGTEAMRVGLHQNVWVNALFSEFKPNISQWLVTDVRFPNEAEAVKKHHGIMLRINRGEAPANAHVSETSLDDYAFDYVIDNNGTMEDLVTKVREFCQKYGLKEANHYEPDHVGGFF